MLTQERTLQYLLPLFIVRPQSFHLLLWHRTRLHSVTYFRERKYKQGVSMHSAEQSQNKPYLTEAGATMKEIEKLPTIK